MKQKNKEKLEDKIKKITDDTLCSKAIEEKVSEHVVMYKCSYEDHYCTNPYQHKNCPYIWYYEAKDDDK